MPDLPTVDAKGLEDLENEWTRNPRTASFYALASRYFEAGRTEDAYDVLRRGLEVHRSHEPARELLVRVTAALDNTRSSRPGNSALARVKVRSVRTPVEERVSQRVAARQVADAPPSKVARHRPPPENPFASDPGDGFPPPAATPPPMSRENLQVVYERKKGATTLHPRRTLAIAAMIVLLVVAAAVAAYLIFHPF
jgi:hypothetical protein